MALKHQIAGVSGYRWHTTILVLQIIVWVLVMVVFRVKYIFPGMAMKNLCTVQ